MVLLLKRIKEGNMIDKKLEEAFNDQINKELYSAYLYLAMKVKFQEMNLQGFVNWFDVQVQEEKAHAMGMFNYLNESLILMNLGSYVLIHITIHSELCSHSKVYKV